MGDEAVDRLSELPESLILHILSLLETRESFRTSLLSKHWVDLWTNVPCLEFIAKKDADAALIDKVLRRWRAIKILKFKIDLSRLVAFNVDVSQHLDFWLRFATEKKVESLEIYLPFDWSRPRKNPPGYEPPQCLYSCSSITKLVLVGFSLGNIVKVQWYNLKSLHLQGLSFSEVIIDRVVSSAPKLEQLDLQLYRGDGGGGHWNIRSSSLKRLQVAKYMSYSEVYDPSKYTKLTIWAPKLEKLRIGGNGFCSKCLLMDVSSVTRTGLYIYDVWDVVIRDTLMQILPKLQHVEALTLSPCSLKMLGIMLKGKHSISPFSNVKKLEFYGGPIKPNEIVGLAQMFPKVETLKIHWKLDGWYPLFLAKLSENNLVVDNDNNEAIIKNLQSFWMPLKRVDFTLHSYEDSSTLFVLIDFLAKHATMVEGMIVIQKGGSADVAAEAQFRVMCLQQIFPTKQLSITFSDSMIIIKRIQLRYN